MRSLRHVAGVVVGVLALTSTTAIAAPPAKAKRALPSKSTTTTKKKPTLAAKPLPPPAPIPEPAPPPPPVVAEPTPPPPPPPAPAPVLIDTDRDRDRDRDHVEPKAPVTPRHHFTASLNPIPIVAGRYGLNVEFLPLKHHAIFASGWLQTFTPAMLRIVMPKEINVDNGADAKLGGELGYRFYTGQDGANGLFAGISGVAMPIMFPRVTAQDLKSEVVSFHAYGGAIDVGVQAITSSGFTIGGGVGVMYLAYTPPASPPPPPGVTAPSYPDLHVMPRFLLAAGWSF